MAGEREKSYMCAFCGRWYRESDLTDYCGYRVCWGCLRAETFECEECGKRVPRSEVATFDCDGVEICQTCYDEHYTRCDACGLLLRQDEAHWRTKDGYERPYCNDCIRKLDKTN